MENDSIPTERITKRLQDAGIEAIHIKKLLPPALIKACYAQMDAFLATRLHSGIYAIGMTVPTLFIGYLSKTQGIVRSLKIEDDFIDLSDLNVTMLTAKLEELWVNCDEKHTRLTKTIRESQLLQVNSIKLLQQDLSNG